jgi:hypothetical protein
MDHLDWSASKAKQIADMVNNIFRMEDKNGDGFLSEEEVEQSFMYKKIVEELEQASLFDMFKEEL